MADLQEKTSAELGNISKLVLEIKKLQNIKALNKYQINSAALYLHNFYNGVENILKQFVLEYRIKLERSPKASEGVSSQKVPEGRMGAILVARCATCC